MSGVGARVRAAPSCRVRGRRRGVVGRGGACCAAGGAARRRAAAGAGAAGDGGGTWASCVGAGAGAVPSCSAA